MSIEISREIAARLTGEAPRQSISGDALLDPLRSDRRAAPRSPAPAQPPSCPFFILERWPLYQKKHTLTCPATPGLCQLNAHTYQ